ncbi:hypothetical protein T484DRAFT_1808915 [Baffinella frigidus]|nr:hypothetical protein T484DRAFT_1808915 [Cryptophyta sp. CCMP2293]
MGEEAAGWAAARGDGGVRAGARRSGLEGAGAAAVAGEERRAAGDDATCTADVQAVRVEGASIALPREHRAGWEEGGASARGAHRGSVGRNRRWDGESSTAASRWEAMACRWTVGALMVLLHVSSAGAQPCAHNPVIQNVSAILGIQGTVLDSSGNLGGTPVPGPQQILSLPNSDPRRETITLVVGSTVLLNISASWGSQYQNQNLSLYAYEDPGVPNGAVLSTQECLGNFGACNPNLSLFVYEDPGVPNGAVLSTQKCLGSYGACNPECLGSYGACNPAGMTHSMCFLALPKPALSGASLTQCQSPFKCVDLRVVAPELTWVRPGTPLPKQEYHSPVGCHLELCFEAYDASSLYTVDVTPVDAKLPPGASFDTECAVNLNP